MPQNTYCNRIRRRLRCAHFEQLKCGAHSRRGTPATTTIARAAVRAVTEDRRPTSEPGNRSKSAGKSIACKWRLVVPRQPSLLLGQKNLPATARTPGDAILAAAGAVFRAEITLSRSAVALAGGRFLRSVRRRRADTSEGALDRAHIEGSGIGAAHCDGRRPASCARHVSREARRAAARRRTRRAARSSRPEQARASRRHARRHSGYDRGRAALVAQRQQLSVRAGGGG